VHEHARCRCRSPPRYADAGGNVKTSAAWFIERAGFGKGFGMPGPAALSTKHTLAVTNRGGATASEIADLGRTVRDGVHDVFGVTLVNEPVFVGHSL
jgi:UDP-N-acetylmuramate dehydrogenase